MTPLLEAVHAGDVAAIADELLGTERPERHDGVDPSMLHRIIDCCERIAAELAIEQAEVVRHLTDAGVQVTAEPVPRRVQRHSTTLRVVDAATAGRAADALARIGFERWDPWQRGALVSFMRHAGHLTVGRTGATTLVIRLAWAEPPPRSSLHRLLRPTWGDWEMIELPTWAWRAYPLVRLTRLVAERTGLRRRHAGGLGPFLATPESLLVPLLEVAAPQEDDVVVDLGCGDGRLLVVAAATFGCRALGVEASPELARRAQDRADRAGVADRVRVVTADARTVDLGDADVVFAFLPTDVLRDTVPTALAAMRAGAKLITHEQNRIPESVRPRPNESCVVVADDALTVAHRWDA